MESVFIEIIQKDSKHMVVGYIYRHPCMQHSELNDEYRKPLSEKLIRENKETIFLGDFRVDLLKCHLNKNNSDFIDIIYSTNLVPNITAPNYTQLHNNTKFKERPL